jgi:uncharacterized membrane protein YbhN (UPF0104 family)
MSVSAETAPAPTPRSHRIFRIVAWLAGLAVLVGVLELLDVDLVSWIDSVWDAISSISLAYLLLGLVFQTIQTCLTALAWVPILRAAYPDAGVTYPPILTAYAVGVAMNGVLPANIGTFVMLLMFLALVPGSNFPGILSGYLVQKIFFTVIGALVYLYLFLSVPGSFSIQLGNISDHPAATAVIVVGGIVLIAMLIRIFWRWVRKLWLQAKQGAAILSTPRRYFVGVFLPSLGGYAAKLCVIGVFLAAFAIPVTFHSIMSVVGSNSLANVTSVTPGGVGVNQALNAAALTNYTDSATATAYSITQQLVTTAWNILFAIVLVAVVLGWSGGKLLIRDSYTDAKVRASEMKRRRKDTDEPAEPEA